MVKYEDLKDELLKMLNTAFEMEYNDVFLYLKEADFVRKELKDKGDKVAKLFERYSQQELRHVDLLASKITELGGTASWDYKPVQTENSINGILKQHMKSESNAFFHYGNMLKYITDPDFKKMIEEIQATEKEHLDKITMIVKKIAELSGENTANDDEDEEDGYDYYDFLEET